MIEQDTIKLLRECDAGIKMGISAIDDVLEYVKSEKLKKYLKDCRDEHDRLVSSSTRRRVTTHRGCPVS